HDLAQGLGAPAVLVTRSRRDARSPALASRFWLRLEALAGERFEQAEELIGWVRALDDAGEPQPVGRPAPMPPVTLRPREIAVTEVDRLKADPYAFYARRILRLAPLDAVDADPSAAWRGTAVHDVLQRWAQDHHCAIGALRPLAADMIADERTHPLLRALWWPRLAEAIDWTAAEMARLTQEGRAVLAVEGAGRAELAGITLTGRFDRIDALPGGGIGIVDYKTGKPPSARAVAEGFSLQLGLLGHIAAAGGFERVAGDPAAFEYWSLARNRQGGFGYRESPCDPDGKRDKVVTADFVALARASFAATAGRWLTGEEPFTAKLHPDHAPYADYDQLMRQDEWYGRE
ncbi:PD-(D/E)XK nuclease family protein, partial [Sphingomonas bacterium]|uniref:PD-(D/E)XK nuclease family protein n=1 Tax=Sphingomonas bacterium TaxID=1895847 RepID=UPI0015766525